MGIDQMAVLDHIGPAWRQGRAGGQDLRRAVADIDVAQPIVHQRAQIAVRDAQQAGQRLQPCAAAGAGAAAGNW